MYAVQQAFEISRASDGRGTTDHGSCYGQYDASPNHETEYGVDVGTQRPTNTEFPRAPCNIVRKEPVDTDAGQQEREQSKEAGQPRD